MRRGEKVWTVMEVRKTEAPSTAANPVYCIFLSDEPHCGPNSLSTRH
jgi:hypothetical protein